jgi:hypothetical protein
LVASRRDGTERVDYSLEHLAIIGGLILVILNDLPEI